MEIRIEIPTAEQMAQYQWFVAEKTRDDFNQMPGWTNCAQQGGQYEERLPYTEGYHICQYTSKGVFGGKDFHKTPHYGLSPSQVPDFLDKAGENGIPVVQYGKKR